jgi:hypothetical protein
MAYSGRYVVANRNKYKGDADNVVYRSLWELQCFKWCDSNSAIKYWSSEETVIPYFYDVDKKYHRYFVDLKITYNDGRTVLIEIKPDKETKPPTGQRRTKKYINESLTYIKNMNKWEAANEFCKDRGWEFHIWTEETLREMGLLTKPVPGKLKKPLKKMTPYRKKKPRKK